MPIRDDRRRPAPAAITVRSPQALLVLAAVSIAEPNLNRAAGSRVR